MSLILDTGALIGYERGSRTVQAFLECADRSGEDVRTTDGGGPPTRGTAIRGRRAWRFCFAALVDVARDGDEILTADPADIRAVVAAAGKRVLVTRVS